MSRFDSTWRGAYTSCSCSARQHTVYSNRRSHAHAKQRKRRTKSNSLDTNSCHQTRRKTQERNHSGRAAFVQRKEKYMDNENLKLRKIGRNYKVFLQTRKRAHNIQKLRTDYSFSTQKRQQGKLLSNDRRARVGARGRWGRRRVSRQCRGGTGTGARRSRHDRALGRTAPHHGPRTERGGRNHRGFQRRDADRCDRGRFAADTGRRDAANAAADSASARAEWECRGHD